MSLKRVLAVTHEATLTGAPMNLLHLLRWMAADGMDVHTLIVRDGPLRQYFEEVGPVTVLDRTSAGEMLGAVQQGLVHLGSRRAWRAVASARLAPHRRRLRHFDLVYLNSATSIGVLPFLGHDGPVVSHVHELQVAIRGWRPESDRDQFLSRPDRWIAASDAVRTMLVDELELDSDRVLLHHEFIDTARILGREVSAREVERCRREYHIPEEASIVMGAGTVDWRKGPDLFVQLATEVRRRSRDPVHFVWVGGDLTGTDMQRLRSDMDRSGADHVHFVGVRPDPLPWFSMADVFALTSREDPFPLVCLEHAVLGHPIVTYRNGGMVELLEPAGPEAARGIVDHLDVGSMAERVLWFLNSDADRLAAGAQLRERVLNHHDVSVAAPALLDDLRSLVETRGRV